jgi:hypothetical protein
VQRKSAETIFRFESSVYALALERLVAIIQQFTWVSSLTRLFITSSYYRESLAIGASTNTTYLTDTKPTYPELEPPTSGAHGCYE